jgi:hypothetical protein
MKAIGDFRYYARAPKMIPILCQYDQMLRTSVITTSAAGHFAPLDAMLEGLGLILVTEINYHDNNICL